MFAYCIVPLITVGTALPVRLQGSSWHCLINNLALLAESDSLSNKHNSNKLNF